MIPRFSLSITSMGCGKTGPEDPGTQKFSEEILQWAGTYKVLAENVSGYGVLGDLHIRTYIHVKC